MRLTRTVFVLAIVAALWVAPSSVSAAANELSAPEVSPGTGSVITVFTFRVRYDGGFPATSISVRVAGLTVPMALTSGSSIAGWWSAVTLLPSGAWSTSFRATAEQGPAVTIAGPVVIVAGAVAPSPTSSTVTSPDSGATPESAPTDGLDGATPPPAAPAPPPEEAAATATSVASAEPATSEPDPAPGDPGGSDPPPEGGLAATPPPGDGDGDAPPADGRTTGGDGETPTVEAAPAASSGAAPVLGDDPPKTRPVADGSAPDDDGARTVEVVSDVVLIGLAGVASVAIIGTLLLVAGRRREPEPAPVGTTSSDAPVALRRRLARDGRARPGDDPIVAALGVDEEMAARRAIRRAERRIDDDVRQGRRPKGR